MVSEEDEEVIKINGGNNKLQVVVDPVDYTHFFLRGEFSFCSVGLMVLIEGFPKYSFVGSILNNDMYHCDEKSAYKNNKKITVPTEIQGKNIIVGYAPYKLRAKKFVDGLADLTDGNYLIYNFGGLLHAAKIADGIYDALIEVHDESLHEFAGEAIAERAGGVISTLEGKPIEWNPLKKQTLICQKYTTSLNGWWIKSTMKYQEWYISEHAQKWKAVSGANMPPMFHGWSAFHF